MSLNVLRVLRSPGAVTFAGSLISAGTAFVINILMARSVGPAGRGEVAWALQFSYILAPLLTVGLERYTLVHSGGLRFGRPKLVWPIVVLLTLAAAVLLPGPLTMVALMGVVAGYTNIVRSQAIAAAKYTTYAIWQAGYNGWLLASAILLFSLDVDSAMAWAAIYAVPAIAAFWVESRSALEPVPAKMSVRYLPGTVNTLLAGRGERLLLPVLASPRELGLYMAVATSVEMLSWAGLGINERAITKDHSQRVSASRTLKQVALSLAAFGAAGIPIAIVTHYVVVPLLGPDFSASATLILPLLAATVLWNAYRQVLAPIIATSHRLATGLESGSTALIIVASIVFIPLYGAAGAAYACIAAYGLSLAACVLIRVTSAFAKRDNAIHEDTYSEGKHSA